MTESEILSKLAESVEVGEPEDAAALAQQALDEGLDPLKCINKGLTPGITKIGDAFSRGDAYLPDLILGGEAMKSALAILEPMSALLTTTMRAQHTIIAALKEAGIRSQVKVMIGGAPVTQSWADEIGADGYAEDAISAIDLAYRLIDAPA
jgi:methanogenic corrinoid protein MtbC1